MYLEVLRRSWWIVAMLTVLGGGAGSAYAYTREPVYAASVTFFAATPYTTNGSALAGDDFGQQRVNTYTHLLKSDRLARAILTADPSFRISRADLSQSLTGSADLNTVLLTADVQAGSTDVALRIATDVGRQFPIMVQQVETTNSAQPAVSLVVVSGPSVQLTPVSPLKSLIIAIALAIGLALGLLVAIARDVLDNKVRKTEQLRQLVGAPLLGVIPNDQQATKQPIVVGDDKYSPRAEAFRRVRTSLRFVSVQQRTTVIAISSGSEGEGKTSVTANLAAAFATAGERVLVIDGDLRRPRLGALFDVDHRAGLTDVLLGSVAVEEAVVRGPVDGMWVLGSGERAPNPAELLGSKAMHALIADVRENYDVVLIDTPPILPVTDAVVVGDACDGLLLVVRAGRSTRHKVVEAVTTAADSGTRLIGTVLNGVAVKRSDSYYDSNRSEVSNKTRRGTSASQALPPSPSTAPVAAAASAPPALAADELEIGSRMASVGVKPAADVEVKPAADVEVKPAADVEVEPAADVEVEPAADVEVEPAADVKVESVDALGRGLIIERETEASAEAPELSVTEAIPQVPSADVSTAGQSRPATEDAQTAGASYRRGASSQIEDGAPAVAVENGSPARHRRRGLTHPSVGVRRRFGQQAP
ncbi:capsular exopolysaccharide synthesis family protein [Nakamurella sp. UYEF19]|uniref:polysaccharide biosynthesis tyrosine autokinase n=1 Tax=Nakamurella sp. UYEF19 TaxID=1756392 RepID=UPI003398D3D3